MITRDGFHVACNQDGVISLTWNVNYKSRMVIDFHEGKCHRFLKADSVTDAEEQTFLKAIKDFNPKLIKEGPLW